MTKYKVFKNTNLDMLMAEVQRWFDSKDWNIKSEGGIAINNGEYIQAATVNDKPFIDRKAFEKHGWEGLIKLDTTKVP
jgi:hypothetical protein